MFAEYNGTLRHDCLRIAMVRVKHETTSTYVLARTTMSLLQPCEYNGHAWSSAELGLRIEIRDQADLRLGPCEF